MNDVIADAGDPTTNIWTGFSNDNDMLNNFVILSL
jgi:hypothetical protein